jgi:phosphate transport system substrate-binding protein
LIWASLKNDAGNYEEPSLNGATKAAEGITLPDDMKIMITNSSNPEAYPIAGFTWILAFIDQKDQAKGQTLANLLWWAIHDGQQFCTALDYAPLSHGAVTKANSIQKISYQGQVFVK